MLDYLYLLFIKPIEILISVFFHLILNATGSAGIALIGVSLIINLLVLPLYLKADELQSEERKKNRRMQKWTKHINKTFHGDERYFMLQTYHKIEKYKPIYALRGSLSLVLEIPFFIAAYHYLSQAKELIGASFGPIANLGMMDMLLHAADMEWNLLPIIMTVFNLASVIIYGDELSMRERIQMYVVAFVFFGLLYTSPSGLLIYWTCNNIFSLGKNIVLKMVKMPPKYVELRDRVNNIKITKTYHGLFLLNNGVAIVMLGAWVPLMVIGSSPMEFSLSNYGPYGIFGRDLIIYIGLFGIWVSFFYYLSNNLVRKILIYIGLCFNLTGIVDVLFWGKEFGFMNAYLEYEMEPKYSIVAIVLSTLFAICIFIGSYLVAKNSKKIAMRVNQIVLITLIGLSIFQLYQIENTLRKEGYYEQHELKTYKPLFSLSTKGENVVVIMLDRAISGYIPFIFENNKQFYEQYDGFTYYPNTLSFGAYTNICVPSLMGGYEYSPTNLNSRDDESMIKKHHEALLLMPTMFKREGFKVTVCDPPYAGYKWNPDLSIYEGTGIQAYNTMSGSLEAYDYKDEKYGDKQVMNFFMYGLFRTVPPVLQNLIYDDGNYIINPKDEEKAVVKTGMITALCHMNDFTNIVEDDSDNLFIITNDTTHEPGLANRVQELEAMKDIVLYPKENVELDGVEMNFDAKLSYEHYIVNIATLAEIGSWLTYLKDNDVYDNTRIIIVSDHGRELGQFSNRNLENGIDVEAYNPLLLVKDFGRHGFEVDEQFMTNADVPALAIDNILNDRSNPFTSKEIDCSGKEIPMIVTTSTNYHLVDPNDTMLNLSDGEYWSVTGNIFTEENWHKQKK